jgi:pilus assembly protein Flp/PilA
MPLLDPIGPAADVPQQHKRKRKNQMKKLMKFIRDEEGLTTVEYAIAGGLVGAGVIGAFNLLGVQVNRVISAIVNALTNITIA